MKWVLLVVLLAFLGISKSQVCNQDCTRSGIEFLCGKTVRNGREIRCTYRNPCEMDKHACQKREGEMKTKTATYMIIKIKILFHQCGEKTRQVDAHATRMNAEGRGKIARRRKSSWIFLRIV